MAQMPIQSVSGRADPFTAAGPAQLFERPRAAIPRAAYVHDSAGISGGRLRPGAIDQELFKAHLAAAEKAAMAAPPAPAGARAFPGIPSLSPAQLAALGAVEEPGELVIDIPAPNPIDPGQGGDRPLSGEAGGIADGTSATASPPGTSEPDRTAPAAPAPTAAPAPADAPTSHAAPASVERGPFPGSRRGADGAWELMRRPDKDERDLLRGQQWRVVENERAQRLFLGPDGEFGWDDFLDLVNPLQHIPFVNMAYRAITGDEIYGAARLVDMAFGPLAGASTAIDLAFRDVTGESMAENAVAALFGPGDAPGGDAGSINTASGAPLQLADAGLIRRGSNR